MSQEAADAARKLVSGAVNDALKVHPSTREHEGRDAFVQDVADMAAKAADFFDDAKRIEEGWPDGWQGRQCMALKAIKQLADVLDSMSPEERECWPEAEAIARSYKIKSSKLTALEKIEGMVFALATLWQKHFGKAPSGAENSPFTSVVQAYYECRTGWSPSHPIIQEAVKHLREQQNN